jgi:hypothetical protein
VLWHGRRLDASCVSSVTSGSGHALLFLLLRRLLAICTTSGRRISCPARPAPANKNDNKQVWHLQHVLAACNLPKLSVDSLYFGRDWGRSPNRRCDHCPSQSHRTKPASCRCQKAQTAGPRLPGALNSSGQARSALSTIDCILQNRGQVATIMPIALLEEPEQSCATPLQ